MLLVSTLASAEIYKWIDAQGNTHFTDSPPAGQIAEAVELQINTYTAVEVSPLEQRLGKPGKVVMYSATWCGICTKAKQYFNSNKIPYVAYDIEKSRAGKSGFKKLNGNGVPIILVGGKRMNGFSVAKFEKLYQQPR
jgi:glutaredoxin